MSACTCMYILTVAVLCIVNEQLKIEVIDGDSLPTQKSKDIV